VVYLCGSLTLHFPLVPHVHCITDAFEDAGDGGNSSEEKVHVRVQQRNGRKCITTVAGLMDDLDVKRICKAFKKNFSCNGAVQKDEDGKEVIQLQGDQRTNVKAFLLDQEICTGESIVLHGF
jgi:translation initiation factor 1